MDQEENAIVANGNMIRLLYSDTPEDVDYSAYGIENAIVLDNTVSAGPRGPRAPPMCSRGRQGRPDRTR